jgi:hypothetical protein
MREGTAAVLSPLIPRTEEVHAMRRQVAVVILSAIIAVGVIYALFDERVSFLGPSYRAPATQTPGG